MCTLALYFHQFAQYPLLVAANRDEHFDRPSAAPALLAGEPKIVAGKDLRAGGTWLGVNEHGLLVGILNRRINGDALPATIARSRGALCMDLLRLNSASAAHKRIATDNHRYNPFTIVFADKLNAYVAYNDDAAIIAQGLESGLHVFSSAAEVDLTSAKAERAHERFASVMSPIHAENSDTEQLLAPMQNVLSDHSLGDGSDNPGDAICVHRESTGTVSSSVIVLKAAQTRFETYFCPGPPCRNQFTAPLGLVVP